MCTIRCLFVPLALSLSSVSLAADVQLTGTQLASALLPVSYFPSGFGEDATAGNIIFHKDQAYGQNVFQFATSAKAAAFYNGMYALNNRCRATRTTSDNAAVKVTARYLIKTPPCTCSPAFRPFGNNGGASMKGVRVPQLPLLRDQCSPDHISGIRGP